MEKIIIPEKSFNKIVDYLNNYFNDYDTFCWQYLLLTFSSSERIFGKIVFSEYYKTIMRKIFNLLIEKNILIVVPGEKFDTYKFKSNEPFNLKKFLLEYFELTDDTNLIVYRHVRDYINNLGVNELLTRQNLLKHLEKTPCFYSENYIDTVRNYLEKSGYIVKATTNTGAIVAGKFYVKKLIPESLTLNDLRKEYQKSLEILYPKKDN